MAVINTEPTGHFLAIGNDDGTVQVVDLSQRNIISRFQTIFDPHSNRVAVTPGTPPIVLAGAWEKHGVQAYDAIKGSPLWQRRELRHVNGFRVLDPYMVSVELNEQPVRVLRASDGEDLAELPGVEGILAYSADRSIVAGEGWAALTDSKFAISQKFPLESFSAMDAALAPGLGAMGEVGGRLLIFDLNGTPIANWRAPDYVLLKVTWDAKAEEWACIVRERQGGDREVVRLSRDGRLIRKFPLKTNIYNEEFLPDGLLAALHTGTSALVDIISASTGASEWRIAD